MFERIAASFALARSTWQVLLSERKLLMFPILSGLGTILVALSFATPFVIHPQLLAFLVDKQEADGKGVPVWFYVVVFAFYFCSYFVIIFCNAALISCALIRFNGGEPTVADGLNAAGSRLPQIAAWALVSATVGMILKLIENAHERVGEFISSLLGLGWTVLTYFVVPVLVVEKVGPFEAIRRSTQILRKTWGEALVGNVGISLVMLLLAIPGILLAVIGIFLCTKVLALGLTVLALAGLYILLLSAAGSALNGIFLTALYQYAANGQVPDGFDRDNMEQAFKHK